MNPCELCDATFTEKSNLHRHVRNIHKKPRIYPCTNQRNYMTQSGERKGSILYTHKNQAYIKDSEKTEFYI